VPSRVGCEDLQNRRVIDEKSWIPVKEKEVGEQLRACLFKDILSEGSEDTSGGRPVVTQKA